MGVATEAGVLLQQLYATSTCRISEHESVRERRLDRMPRSLSHTEAHSVIRRDPPKVRGARQRGMRFEIGDMPVRRFVGKVVKAKGGEGLPLRVSSPVARRRNEGKGDARVT
jgi:hypothetical protein